MENIISRSQFLGQASTLFTDEKTANTRARVRLRIYIFRSCMELTSTVGH